MTGIIVKIGGAYFTNKSGDTALWHDQPGFGADFDKEGVRNVLVSLKDLDDLKAIVFGAGSFGHPAAKMLGLNAVEYVEVEAEMVARLEQNLEVLAEQFVAPLFQELDIDMELLELPRLQRNQRGAVRIVSGDEVVVEHVKRNEANRIVFYSDVEGVEVGGATLSSFAVSDLAGLLQSLSDQESDKVDVTGGMRAKLSCLDCLPDDVLIEFVC